MLNTNILQYIIASSTRGYLWIREYAQFAKKKKHMKSLAKARKEKMDMQSNAKYVDLPKDVNIIKNVLTFVLLNMKDGQKEILTKFLRIKELIITEIKKKSWKSSKNQGKRRDILIQKITEKETKKKLHVIIMSLWQLNSVILYAQNVAIVAKFNVSLKLITMTTQNLSKLFGFVRNVMEKSIGCLYQRERLSLETSQEDAIVQTTEETCRGEFEAVPPPRNWSVSKLLLKVIEWLRHTAGCSFYQGQCITNDLWIQNLRSTGI